MNACETCGDLHDPSDMVNPLEDFYFCYTCEDKNRYSKKVIKEEDNG